MIRIAFARLIGIRAGLTRARTQNGSGKEQKEKAGHGRVVYGKEGKSQIHPVEGERKDSAPRTHPHRFAVSVRITVDTSANAKHPIFRS